MASRPELDDQYRLAMVRARAAGDEEAAAHFERRLGAAEAKRFGPGEGSILERVGAGVQDIVVGAKQLVGAAAPGEAAEQEKIAAQADPQGWGRMAGQLGVVAPASVLVPGAGATMLPRALASAAASGAGAGALMPAEEGDVVGGKLRQAALGAAGGAATQYGISRMLPRALAAGREALARTVPIKALDPARQDIAEEALARSIGYKAQDPAAFAAERQAAMQQLRQYQPEIPGFQQTTAAVTRNPRLLAAEREMREAGGTFAEPLKAKTAKQAQAVEQAWRGEFGGGQAERAREAASEFAESAKGALRLDPAKLHDPDAFMGPIKYLNQHIDTATGDVRKALESVRAELYEAAQVAQRTGSVNPLHQFRMSSVDDALEKMYRTGASKQQKTLRQVLGSDGLKKTFDSEMNALTGNKWGEFIKGYAERAQLATQREAGEEWLTKLAARPATSEGVPQPGGLMPGLRKEIAEGMETRYGTQAYTPEGERLLRATASELERANLPYAVDIAPRGSATAQNLRPLSRAMRDAQRTQRAAEGVDLADIGVGTAAGLATGPVGGVIAGVAKAFIGDPLRARATADIANRLVSLYASPAAALKALERIPLAPVEKAQVRRVLETVIVGTGATAASGPALIERR